MKEGLNDSNSFDDAGDAVAFEVDALAYKIMEDGKVSYEEARKKAMEIIKKYKEEEKVG